ncbi:MAG: C1 family peptidase [Oligoflexia bacterium]|nr:C1 family peptidase [Oligoflexia bacterium]
MKTKSSFSFLLIFFGLFLILIMVVDNAGAFINDQNISAALEEMSALRTTDDYYSSKNQNQDVDVPTELSKNVLPPEMIEEIQSKRDRKSNIDKGINDRSIPDIVDLRKFDSSVKKQFGGTCTAFGLAAAMENFINHRQKQRSATHIEVVDDSLVATTDLLSKYEKIDLSERHLWSTYSFPNVRNAINAAKKNYIVEEKYWPQKNFKPYDNYLKHANSKLHASNYIADNIQAALEALAKGHPVYLGTSTSRGLSKCASIVNPLSIPNGGGHAMAIVGYKINRKILGGGYFIVKNSWGTNCGDKGYQYLPFFHCKRKSMYCLMWEISDIQSKQAIST